MRVAQSADIQSLDPWTATDDQTITVLRQVYEGLVDLESGGVRVVPKLAESWTTSADGRVWTFRLRQGVTFHDGSPFDAATVVRNFDRARAFARFDLGTLVSNVAAPDRMTVAFTLTTASASFLATLASGSFAIVNPACFAQGPSWSTAASRCAQGTGPFRYEAGAWRAGESITLQRYASYWGRDADGRALPYVDTLVFTAIRDDAARVAELRAASVAVALDVGPGSLAAVRSDPNLAIRRRPAYDVSYVGIGTLKPFDDPSVRRAVALSIDRGAIVQTVYGGEARAASQLVPPGFLGYDDTIVEFSKYDANAAKKALSDAGYGAGISVDLWYVPAPRSALPDPKRIAETIAADLGKVGIAVKLQTAADASALATQARAGTLALWIDDRTADRADPEDFFTGVSADPVANELLRRARSEVDPSKRAELYKQVTKMWTADIPRVPLFNAAPPIALTRKLPGLIPQPIVGESFAGVWIGR